VVDADRQADHRGDDYGEFFEFPDHADGGDNSDGS
jgi:hypothetical protein